MKRQTTTYNYHISATTYNYHIFFLTESSRANQWGLVCQIQMNLVNPQFPTYNIAVLSGRLSAPPSLLRRLIHPIKILIWLLLRISAINNHPMKHKLSSTVSSRFPIVQFRIKYHNCPPLSHSFPRHSDHRKIPAYLSYRYFRPRPLSPVAHVLPQSLLLLQHLQHAVDARSNVRRARIALRLRVCGTARCRVLQMESL